MIAELSQKIKEVATLCERFGVQDLFIFGSAAEASDISKVRDLDFLVRFSDMPPVSYADSYFGLAESLSNLFGMKVDLIEEIAIRNPFFRKSIDNVKERLYGSS